MHHQNTPLKVYESRRFTKYLSKGSNLARERERNRVIRVWRNQHEEPETRPSVWLGHPPRCGIVASFGLPAFYNAEVAAVFSAAICFPSLSLSLCAPPAPSKALPQQQQHRPLFVLSRSLLLGSSRLFLLRERYGDSFRVVNRFYCLQLFCVFILRVICRNFFLLPFASSLKRRFQDFVRR